MKSFLTALQFLTRIHLRQQSNLVVEDFGRSTKFFPLVGLVLGLIYLLAYGFTKKAYIWLGNITFSSIALGLLCNAFSPQVSFLTIPFAILIGLGTTIGMINILGVARKHGAKILQASTSEVYGDPEIHPQTEEYRGNVNPDGPRACYDEGKRCAETLCFDYWRMHGLKIKIVRIFIFF